MAISLLSRLSIWGLGSPAFKFVDPGPLSDGELHLIPPHRKWVDAVLAACHHPLCIQRDPELASTTRAQLLEFVEVCPQGHQRPQVAGGILPTYQFWMHVDDNPTLPIAGGIGLRIGNTYETVMYYGHIGYHVYPTARGRKYAGRASRLLLPLAARHGINPLWITCNPDNIASRKTCEALGAELVEIVPVPPEHPLHLRGDLEKCRYRIDL